MLAELSWRLLQHRVAIALLFSRGMKTEIDIFYSLGYRPLAG